MASFLYPIHPSALSAETANYLAMIVLEQPEEGLLNQLSQLHPHNKYQIAVVQRSSSDTIEQIISLAKELKVPPIFVQPKEPYINEVVSGYPSLFVSLISPQSNNKDDLAAHFIDHPKTANFSWIGYQSYLVPPEMLSKLQARYFSSLRLGNFREDYSAAEPLIRNNLLHFIDFSALRNCDAPDGIGQGPNGLYAEEICQLAHYMGAASRLEACFLYGYPKKITHRQIITSLIAQTLWHLFESLSALHYEDPGSKHSQNCLFTTKEVYIGDHDHILYFVTSNQTGRWWIKIDGLEGITHYIPCMYNDYSLALQGELPLVWLRHYQKINGE